MIECNKCIHYPVCDHSRDYFKYDECSYYSEESRQHGEWLSCKDDNFCKCSGCGQIVMSEERSNFCPNCGADMRREGEK